MSYNIEEQEDYLKNNMPYRLAEGDWEAMQQRLKLKVLQKEEQPPLPRKKKPFFKMAWGVAAGLLLLVSAYTFTRHMTEKPVTGIEKREDPEQYLDKAISSLNEQELDWIHQLNENELTEQEVYYEN
jgi:hypothetical protein